VFNLGKNTPHVLYIFWPEVLFKPFKLVILTERRAVDVLLVSQMAGNLVCKTRHTRLGIFNSLRVFKHTTSTVCLLCVLFEKCCSKP